MQNRMSLLGVITKKRKKEIHRYYYLSIFIKIGLNFLLLCLQFPGQTDGSINRNAHVVIRNKKDSMHVFKQNRFFCKQVESKNTFLESPSSEIAGGGYFSRNYLGIWNQYLIPFYIHQVDGQVRNKTVLFMKLKSIRTYRQFEHIFQTWLWSLSAFRTHQDQNFLQFRARV